MNSSIFGIFGGGSSILFAVIPAIVTIGFIVVIGLLIYRAIQGGAQWSRNNQTPVLTVGAKIVTKRMQIRRHMHNHAGDTGMHHNTTSTTYYATFEFESGDRLELVIPHSEYGLLAERDAGSLTFQGTRYKGFERNTYLEQ